MLVEIQPGLLVNTSNMREVSKRGTYTDIYLFTHDKQHMPISIDDPEDMLWQHLGGAWRGPY